MTLDLVIKGDLVLVSGVTPDGWVGVRDGVIAAVGQGEAPPSLETADHSGKLVFPGIIDGQTHAGSIAGFEGLEDLTRSAAAGGVTTIVDMPFDEPDPVWSRSLLDAKIGTANRVAHVDVALYGSVKKVVETDQIGLLADGGVCAFKMSTYESNPHRFPRIPHDQMARAFAAIADTGLSVAVHNEDQEVVDSAIRAFREQRRMGANVHHPSRPPLAELLANAIILELGAQTGARAHIVHSSLARGFDMARQYREQGFQATAETCIHYLVFDEDDVIERGARGKVNPPIRPDQKDAIWLSLAAGDVAFVSSDHCSWPLERKGDGDIFCRGSRCARCRVPSSRHADCRGEERSRTGTGCRHVVRGAGAALRPVAQEGHHPRGCGRRLRHCGKRDLPPRRRDASLQARPVDALSRHGAFGPCFGSVAARREGIRRPGCPRSPRRRGIRETGLSHEHTHCRHQSEQQP